MLIVYFRLEYLAFASVYLSLSTSTARHPVIDARCRMHSYSTLGLEMSADGVSQTNRLKFGFKRRPCVLIGELHDKCLIRLVGPSKSYSGVPASMIIDDIEQC